MFKPGETLDFGLWGLDSVFKKWNEQFARVHTFTPIHGTGELRLQAGEESLEMVNERGGVERLAFEIALGISEDDSLAGASAGEVLVSGQ